MKSDEPSKMVNITEPNMIQALYERLPLEYIRAKNHLQLHDCVWASDLTYRWEYHHGMDMEWLRQRWELFVRSNAVAGRFHDRSAISASRRTSSTLRSFLGSSKYEPVYVYDHSIHGSMLGLNG